MTKIVYLFGVDHLKVVRYVMCALFIYSFVFFFFFTFVNKPNRFAPNIR